MNKTAIVIGATGLVGSEILNQLLEDESFGKVKILHRRTTGINHPKLEEHIIDFDEPVSWRDLVAGDELYSALGTTIKKAGSQEKQHTIDFSYQYEVAKAAAENGVRKYALVSSAGADSESRVFYSKMKGELDDAVKKLDFDTCVVLRPSILEGEREESRLGETIGMILANIFTKIPGLRKYRPIPGEIVARGAINALRKSAPGYHIFELDEIFEL